MAWTTPKTWAAGEFVDAAEMNAHIRDNINYLNDDRVQYAQRSSDFGGITTAQTIVLSAPAFTPINASRLIRITARWRSASSTVNDDIFAFRIMEFGVGQKNEANVKISATGHGGGTLTTYIASPSASSHTYNLSCDRQLGSGTMTVQGASTYPIQIWVEDIGAA